MTREKFASAVLRILSVVYGLGSVAFAVRALFSGISIPIPPSIDPSLAIGPLWVATGAIIQAVVACAFLAALAESIADVDDVPTLPAPYAEAPMSHPLTPQERVVV
jgi:hypothetical protein